MRDQIVLAITLAIGASSATGIGSQDTDDITDPLGRIDDPVLTKPVPVIPHAPECRLKATTLQEVTSIRARKSQLQYQLYSELQFAEKRKVFIEGMTKFINHHIEELNEVKGQLAKGAKWMSLKSTKLKELQEKEKLIKVADILHCLEKGREKIARAAPGTLSAIKGLKDKVHAVKDEMSTLQTDLSATLASQNQSSAFY